MAAARGKPSRRGSGSLNWKPIAVVGALMVVVFVVQGQLPGIPGSTRVEQHKNPTRGEEVTSDIYDDYGNEEEDRKAVEQVNEQLNRKGSEHEFDHLSRRIPACNKNKKPARSFFIIMTSHAGSTALISQLVEHPQVYWDRGPDAVGTFEPMNQPKFRAKSGNVTAGIEWIREYFTMVLEKGKMPGFKLGILPVLKYPEEFKKIIDEFDTKIIFNYRRDHLKRAIGRYAYHYLGDKTSIGGINTNSEEGLHALEDRCSTGVGCSYEITNMANLHCIMTRSWKAHQYKVDGIKKISDGCVLEEPYEDYLNYPTDVYHQSLDFLGLERVDTSAAREKGTSDKICEVVENFAELCAAFAECPAWNESLLNREDGCSCDDYKYTPQGGPGVNPICETWPPEGYEKWCFGICEACPETLTLRERAGRRWPWIPESKETWETYRKEQGLDR
uniref:Sulfotransferase domain-containing protein n=1 Tax=Rhodosorus marinus TaxID=101924 RepID=A0A7S2ZIN3_9RHOD